MCCISLLRKFRGLVLPYRLHRKQYDNLHDMKTLISLESDLPESMTPDRAHTESPLLGRICCDPEHVKDGTSCILTCRGVTTCVPPGERFMV